MREDVEAVLAGAPVHFTLARQTRNALQRGLQRPPRTGRLIAHWFAGLVHVLDKVHEISSVDASRVLALSYVYERVLHAA